MACVFAARVVGAAQTRTCRCKLVACGQLTQVRIYGFGAMSRGLRRRTSASGTSWRKDTRLKKCLKSKMHLKTAEVFKLNININTARCWILDTNYWPNIQQKGWSLRFRVPCYLSLILNHESKKLYLFESTKTFLDITRCYPQNCANPHERPTNSTPALFMIPQCTAAFPAHMATHLVLSNVLTGCYYANICTSLCVRAAEGLVSVSDRQKNSSGILRGMWLSSNET